MEFALRHPYPLEALMAWRPAMTAPGQARYRQILADPAFRRALIHEMGQRAVTSTVADAYRIPGRGRIVPGAWADLMLFDPTTVARGPKRRVNDLPTGASRLDTPAVGLHGVWVNGIRAVDERGGLRDCGRPGRVLREFAA